jgi:outer membrane protein assembly factor BamB
MLRSALPASLLLLALSTMTPVAHAENWPQWRGPRLDNVSQETGAPVKWSKTENVVWRTPMPGPAGATPVFWGDRIFLTSARGEDLLLLALDTKGKILWEQVMATGNKDVRGDEGNSAAPSPATDGKHVWAMMATGVIGCYDFAGKEVWKFNLPDRYGRFSIAFGLTSTPILDGDRLYVQLIHGEGNAKTREAVVVCLDKATGKEIWKVDRPSDAHSECEHSYASPTLYRDGQREYLITHGADFVVAHRLSDGVEVWRCGGLNPKVGYNPTLRFVASPAAADGLIVVPSAKGGPVLGISPEAKGDITETTGAHVWTRAKDTPDVPTPLIHDGLVYLCRENGNLLCLDAKTGEEIYYEPTHRQRHRASPVYADGKIYCTARDGVTHVIKAGRKFEILAKNEIGESIAATPVFYGGKLYLRSYEALYCIGN